MIGSGSDDQPGSTHFGGRSRRGGRKNRRKWAPEPSSGQRKPVPNQRSVPPPPPPTRRQRPVPPPAPPPPVTADQAYTVDLRRETPPRPRPRPPKPPAGRNEPGARGFDRYGTDGFVRPRAGDTEHIADTGGSDAAPKGPKKLTVTRVAALRGKELSGRAVGAFHRVHKADGAEESGLTSLSWALMLNYASDAALAIALANTLFFSAASAESKWKVALYLLITIAPFGFIAPFIGPALDRVQRGRRLAMSITSAGSAFMCVIIAVNFDGWLLYPAALGKMVLSKSFMVLKSAVTPRVVPPEITLSKTNARLTVFGLAAAGVGGTIAGLFSLVADSPGALWFAATICTVGAFQAMRIPAWVESTEGEVPATLHSQAIRRPNHPQPITQAVAIALWGNGSIRLLTGFLMLFAAFAVKAATEHDKSPVMQLVLLGVIGGAAAAGGFIGNALGSRLHFGRPDQVIVAAVAGTLVSTVIATLLEGVATAALVGLIGATGSALAKISLDAVIQENLPEESRASAFGRSETVLQLSWCFGGAVGLLLPPTYWIGFLVVSVLLAIGLAQTLMVQRGKTLVPPIGRKRDRPAPAAQRVPH